jgi:hypothetical protein
VVWIPIDLQFFPEIQYLTQNVQEINDVEVKKPDLKLMNKREINSDLPLCYSIVILSIGRSP